VVASEWQTSGKAELAHPYSYQVLSPSLCFSLSLTIAPSLAFIGSSQYTARSPLEMAEILGVIASGVSIGALAGQIASSVVKLKTYLDQVRDAPEDIKILIDEIDNLHLLLSDIEDDQSRNPYSAMLVDNSSALRCLDHCKRGVERLQRVADEMAVNFEDVKPMKKKLISAKIVWKRDKVERYRAELASAVRLLTLACQIYTT
jgi:hypothetical protein